ncbi:MAG TPA: WGxxGxxG family protein [Sphingomicrobium sp.]|jgi:hypothetical protein|nr:WGxxGxxG family protein [Sphingomicrobium sp.]
MRSRVLLAILVGTLAASQPVSAQVTNDTGIRTETQDRMRMQGQWEFPWDLLGLFGLLGLLGLRRGHDEDSYHPAPVE